MASIHDHDSWLPKATGVDSNKLGAVMLPVEFREGLLQRGYDHGGLKPGDLMTASNPDLFWVKGDVTAKAHVTLLYGLMIPAYEQPQVIYRLLRDWERPATLTVSHFEGFASPFAAEPYVAIVARVADYGSLEQASGLLRYLPHVDTFPGPTKYHATVAYVTPEAAPTWLDFFNSRQGQILDVPALMGSLPSLDLGSSK
jgi:hypothetical protein